MLSHADIVAITRRVRFLDWTFRVNKLRDLTGGWFLSIAFRDLAGNQQIGRKWFVSQHSCQSEVVQTCLLAVLTAVEHEARETFLFDGQAIYGPHLDAEALRGVRHQCRVPKSNDGHSHSTAPCPQCGDLDGCHEVARDY